MRVAAVDRGASSGRGMAAEVGAHPRERFRPATTVLAQAEIHPRARIRTVGSG